ncbi:DoxX family membrane protein [Aldersonia sp. NBC_00410]|uniref:DoxX family protein n=1 Tax=Aldersonia sp. NBC_00410 TaxID=2975954 RepID=UPI0022523941|nr:DoxX family membrane protein [Aldersonia sp. NBC_00410]MCX5046119.1 DoxX family membrane protein [Aldersonia sp. NBC_00410]
MSDEPSNQTSRPGRASSPYDEPTEQIPVQHGQTSVPRSDDDLGPDPSQTPAYKPTGQSPSAHPTEQLPTYSAENTGYTGENPAAQPRTYAFAGPAGQPTETGPIAEPAPEQYRDEPPRRGTTDLGLLVLRVTIGAVFFMHGLQKLTGWWGGPGLDGIESMMDRGGWDQPLATGVLLMVGEIAGGALLILGLASPLAAGALLAIGIDAWLFRQVASPGLQYFNPDGPELESVLVAATTSIILTGPGRISLDGGRGWATRPAFGSFFVLLLAVAAATCTWVFLHGGNPFI